MAFMFGGIGSPEEFTSAKREAFKAGIVAASEKAIKAEHIKIKSVKAGSVIVETDIMFSGMDVEQVASKVEELKEKIESNVGDLFPAADFGDVVLVSPDAAFFLSWHTFGSCCSSWI